jgi:hypothetical protein
MLRQYPVQIYSTFKNQFPKMSFVQFDSKSSRISFELYNNIDDPMTDIIEAVATVQRSDGVEKTYGMTLYSESEEKDIPVFEISGNIVTFILPVSALYVKGRTYCQIYLYDSNYGRITIPTFTYEVLEQLVDDIPQDTVDSYPVLSNMLGSENTRITNEEERISAEQERISAESLRTSAETSRANAESARAAEYQQIKGIIMDENNAVNLQNQINFIDSSLNDKVNKLTRVYNFDEYGGIPEDSSKDNAPALNSLISSITQGSIIFLPSRSYYFSTPVNITGGRNIKIVGLGKDSVGGTRLFWTGTGFLFNFYGGAHCEIENLFL